MAYIPPPNGWRTFLILWMTQSISVLGTAVTVFAINIWLATTLYPSPDQKGQLAFALTVFNLAFGLPTILFAPVAGAWADRHDRRRIMMTADLINGFLSLVAMFLLLEGMMQLWMIVVLAVLIAATSSFHSSAFDTSYAMLVPADKLPRANGMMQTIWALSGILAPALAAAIIALPGLARQGHLPNLIGVWLAPQTDGTALAIGLDALTFFLAATTLFFLQIPSPKQDSVTPPKGSGLANLWADIQVGALYIWRRRPLLWLLGTFTVANFTAAPFGVLEPLVLRFNLEADWLAQGFTFEGALALLASIGALGGVVGGALISAWGGLKTRRVFGVLIPLIVAGLVQIVFGLSPFFLLSVTMIFIYNAMIPFSNAHSQAIWQTQTPNELQGRVFAVRRVIAQISWPLGTLLAGILAGLFNPGLVVAILGVIGAVFTISQLFNPVLLRVEDKRWLDDMAVRQTQALPE